jgi:hypothetical protein
MAKIDILLREAQQHFDTQETPIATVMGAYETKIMGKDSVRNGVLVATDKRVIFYAKKMFGFDLEVFPYCNISSIEMGKGFMGHKITFFASGNRVSMKWIRLGQVQELVDHVKAAVGRKEQAAGPAEADIPDQIRKLAELKGDGMLTEEEFQAKKSELLSKI